jgi:uncharacterized membrane protein
MNLESIKNQLRTCLKKEQKRGHQLRKSDVILGDISPKLYGFSLCALNVTPTWSDLVLYYWKSWWFYLCLVGDFTLIFVVEQFVYCCSSGDYWLAKSSYISVEFQSVRSICYLLSSLFFFLSLSPYPLEQKQSWRLKLKKLILSLSQNWFAQSHFLFVRTRMASLP